MSANRSWDIRPSGKPAPKPASAGSVRRAPVRRESVRTERPLPTRREAVARVAPRVTGSLRARRKSARRKIAVIAGVGLVILMALAEVVLWQPFLRVKTVQANGQDADALQAFVLKDLAGTRYFAFPKSSIFFLSQNELRDDILREFPNVQAVSIAPSGLSTLSITTVERASAFWWCGTSFATPQGSCYETDTEGRVFNLVVFGETTASTSMLWVYAPLASTTSATTSPLGASVAHPERLPNVLRFVKAIRTLGANITSVDLRGDEADLYTEAGTRITYVMGREEQAVALAATSFPTLSLNDGSLLYVDLRFDNKIFFKKRGEESPPPK